MKRRDFIKGAILTTTIFAAGRPPVFAKQRNEDLNKLENRENPSALEQKHVPGVDAPAKVPADKWFDVKVKVGYKKEHPSTTGHWIRLMKLLVNGEEVARHTFETGGVSPSASTFTIELAKTSKVEVIADCNLHGVWISDPVEIKVV